MRAHARLAPGILLMLTAVTFGAAACNQMMDSGPRYKPLAESDFFPDGQSARPQVEGTVARGHLRLDDAFSTGRVNGTLVEELPIRVTRDALARGQDRFDIFCSPCHGQRGYGDGVIVERGFPSPPSYHIDRLRDAPVGHFFDVITNGYGEMASYASRVAPNDRWAIVAYIRALQLSQHATIDDVPPDVRRQLLTSRP